MQDRTDHSPTDPNFRWHGPDVTAPKTSDVAQAQRQKQFATLEEFDAWRKQKGFAPLYLDDLKRAFDRYRGAAAA